VNGRGASTVNTVLHVTLQFAGEQVSGCGTTTVDTVLHMKLPLQEG